MFDSKSPSAIEMTYKLSSELSLIESTAETAPKVNKIINNIDNEIRGNFNLEMFSPPKIKIIIFS